MGHVLLFGRVPADRQIYVSAIAFGSVIWLVVLVGVAFPSVGRFLLSFVPLPERVEKKWVRLAMLAAVVVIPAVVGALSVLMLDTHLSFAAEGRPTLALGVSPGTMSVWTVCRPSGFG